VELELLLKEPARLESNSPASIKANLNPSSIGEELMYKTARPYFELLVLKSHWSLGFLLDMGRDRWVLT